MDRRPTIRGKSSSCEPTAQMWFKGAYMYIFFLAFAQNRFNEVGLKSIPTINDFEQHHNLWQYAYVC